MIPSVSLVRGGPSQAVLEMVRGLRAQGVDAAIVTTDDDGPNRLEIETNEWIEYQGLPVRFFRRSSLNINSIKEFSFSSALAVWLERNIASYDLIHVHAIFSFPATVAMALARRHRIPYIVRPLGQLCTWSLEQSALKKKLYLKLIEKANLSSSSGLHLTSEQERREVNQLPFASSTFVNPHGLDFPPPLENARQKLRTQLNLPEDETVILFLSRIHPKKGLDYLISALSRSINHSFTFVLAGSGDPTYEAEVRSMLKESRLDARTILPGFVKGKRKDLLLQGADLYVLTSHSENFGVAVLEALAAGLPALVTPGVALSDEIQSHHFGYVTQLDKDAITATLERYFLDPKAAISMGKRAQQFTLENYTWKRNAENLIQAYQAVLRERSTVRYAEPDNASYSHLQ